MRHLPDCNAPPTRNLIYGYVGGREDYLSVMGLRVGVANFYRVGVANFFGSNIDRY